MFPMQRLGIDEAERADVGIVPVNVVLVAVMRRTLMVVLVRRLAGLRIGLRIEPTQHVLALGRQIIDVGVAEVRGLDQALKRRAMQARAGIECLHRRRHAIARQHRGFLSW